ncbi:hypothetical protein [Noviherbaspirillum pedocola]|uniref:Uncharacterized protein n=1 Tax=Noviherbaspirillum pedocola TaxID=2801341 RepID=A0A934SXJ6_9BURK|nr:hypothetical protein [Noviherbaspirillum pedocola]MBK4737358.1 hypothetical protein [Noviherbaspirillum pedocola]
MITIKTNTHSTTPLLSADKMFEIGFYGVDVDDRGASAVKLCQQRSVSSHLMTYVANDHFIDGNPCPQKAICAYMRGKNEILIECTTLGVAEIIFLFLAAKREKIRDIYLIYAEPGEYTRESRQTLSESTRFHLTGDRQFKGVHGVSLDLSLHSSGRAVFLLGYEDDRLAMLLTQQENLARFKKHAVFGVPAFEPGWELNSFSNHASRLTTEEFEIHYAAANSVTHCMDTLTNIHKVSGSIDSPTIIAPIGTKPHAIAAAAFLCFVCGSQEGGLIYDHPEKPAGRSRALRRWHVFHLNVTC